MRSSLGGLLLSALLARSQPLLEIHAFQAPPCDDLFFRVDEGDVYGEYVWMDYPLAAPQLALSGAIPAGAFQGHPWSDMGSWCDPTLWWPLSVNETRSRNLIAVSSEMGTLGCQYYGNGKSLFYNARNLGFKAFVESAVSTADTCGRGRAGNGSFIQVDVLREQSACAGSTPLYTASLTDNNMYNRVYHNASVAGSISTGYLGALIPSIQPLIGTILYPGLVPTFPSMKLRVYECNVNKVANSVGMFVLCVFLMLFRFFILVESIRLLRKLGVSKILASTGILFGGVFASIASFFELVATPNDLSGLNYRMWYGQKDQVIVLYLPMVLGICSNIAMAWLWLRIGLNLRSLMKGRGGQVYDVMGVLLSMVPIPVLFPKIANDAFDLYDADGLVRQGVDAVLKFADPVKESAERRALRRELYDTTNVIIFGFSLAVVALFIIIQLVAMQRVLSASRFAQSEKGTKTLKRLSMLVLIQSICLLSTAIIVFFLQDMGWEIIEHDAVGQLVVQQYFRAFIACVMAHAQVNAISAAARTRDRITTGYTGDAKVPQVPKLTDSYDSGREAYIPYDMSSRESGRGSIFGRASVVLPARQSKVDDIVPSGQATPRLEEDQVFAYKDPPFVPEPLGMHET